MKILQIDPINYDQNKVVIMIYVSNYYYDINFEVSQKSWKINLELKKLQEVYTKYWEEPLFSSYKKHCEYFFVFDDSAETSPHTDNIEIGYLTIAKNEWNNTLRIWDFYINNKYKRKGVGTQLMNTVLQKAKEYGCRAIVLETQSSNYPAIQFYRKCGFELIGFDILAYSNTDIEKKDVRLELGLKFD